MKKSSALVKHRWIFFLVTLVLFFALNLFAQDTLLDPSEMPPEEPPYTTNSPRSSKKADPLSEAPASGFEETQMDAMPESVYTEPEVFDPLQNPSDQNQDVEQVRESATYPEPKDIVVRDLIEKKESGVYYYKYERKAGTRRSGHLKIGLMSPPSISTLVGGEYELTYEEMYTSSPVPLFNYEMEWAIFESWPGLRAQGGVGAFFAQGNGRFARDVIDGEGEPTNIAKEKYTFIGVPVSAGLILRLQVGNSWFVPFVNGGANYTGLVETRDDAAKRNLLASPSFYGGGGVMINMTALDREAAFIFDREYSIGNLWLTAEGRIVKSLSQELNVSSNIIFMGVSADY